MTQAWRFKSQGSLCGSIEVVRSIIVSDRLASETGGCDRSVDIAQRHTVQMSQSTVLETLSELAGCQIAEYLPTSIEMVSHDEGWGRGEMLHK